MVGLSKGMWNLVLQLLKASFLHYYNVYVHKTWQGGNLLFAVPAHEITWRFDHVALQDNVTN